MVKQHVQRHNSFSMSAPARRLLGSEPSICRNHAPCGIGDVPFFVSLFLEPCSTLATSPPPPTMLISTEIAEAINAQIGMEFSASLQYDAIGAHFASESLPKLATHFFQQATEERGHAHRFMKYLIDCGCRVLIPALAKPVDRFQFAKDAVRLSYDREMDVTRSINAIQDLAVKNGDHLTITFLQWFIREQLEEVASMEGLLKTVERAGEGGLLLVEQLLGSGGLSGGGPAIPNDGAA
jgi:bacterioferritin B